MFNVESTSSTGVSGRSRAHGRERVEAVHMIDVDMIRAQAAQAVLARGNKVVARRAQIIWTLTGAESRFGRNQQIVAFARDRLA